ncbi:GNAT family N-acetyltransferase [Vagococcus fluvialis]|jgi:ribosomal protein S18 acetylase RimI-like enzyme|uniref:GNAT family N-acetyltransferase n=1 Tax=Vagococcus fluvialis TaxID=2738 RepID=UPI001A8F657F|nr:GNAT family N-acetyltransferase [Vagococcus fluvialis]MBO0480389.1 GNAT family N-acetyltransferase [Vagococcus fluvialis]MBO0484243.1 GNAT family N-acetyltransferase [Vagococcus fluvialis]UDM71320.1 GNAT family N-acetyltransferase [Vagococcus fluvialis]UDM76182.1 GNAT family N-acetyltransferase [Vagococcus fluvialis]UDM83011.1 GNAT family N-acetyltransferase [Vagococcus fluvialis]
MIHYKENYQIDKSDLEKLYSSVGWAAYTKNLEVLEQAINHSLQVISAWNEDELVGLIRVIGDGFTIIYVQDILVHPDYQDKKIGTELMTKILDNYPEVRQKVLLTEDAPDVRHFYEKFGFTSCDKGNAVAFYKEF